MDDIKLYNGDCFDVMINKDIKFDCLITDPPYYTPAKISATRKEFRRSVGNMGVLKSFFVALAERVEKGINSAGHIYIFCDSRTYPFILPAFYNMTKDVRAIIWDKMVSINGYAWRRQHEMILFGEMPKAKPVPTGDGDIIKMRAVKIDDRYHPAEKPVELLKRLILKSTKKGDVVFDPFMGSGSTGKAARQLGRKFIGCEIDEGYYKKAKEKIYEDDIKVLGFG